MGVPTAIGVAGIASAGAGIGGAAIQGSAAQQAAAQQVAAEQKGVTLTQQNLQNALGPMFAQMGFLGSTYAPYQAGGAQGINALAQGLAPGGNLIQPWTQQFQAPTAAQAEQNPAYQFALNQGLGAINAGAAARGTAMTGGTQKSLAQFASGLASQTYQQTYNNAMNAYNFNYQTWANNQANAYQRLMGLSGTGLSANQNLAAAQGGMLSNIANLYNANSQQIAGLYGAQGAAQASGTMGQANAWAQGLGGIGQTATGLAGMYTGYQTGQQQLQALQNLGLGMGGLGGFAGAVQTPLNNPNVYLGSFAPGTYAPYAIS